MPDASFTGRTRRRKTSRRVLAADKVSRFLITGGGLATVFAVALICVFLVLVVVPLFAPAEISSVGAYPVPEGVAHRVIDDAAADEYRLLFWTLQREDGHLRVHRLEDGSLVGSSGPAFHAPPTALARVPGGASLAAGFEDGTIEVARIAIEPEYLDFAGRVGRALADAPEAAQRFSVREEARPGEVVERMRAIRADPALFASVPPADREALDARLDELQRLVETPVGSSRVFEGGVAQVTPEMQIRVQRVTLADRVTLKERLPAPVRALDVTAITGGLAVAALSAEGALHLHRLTVRRDQMTGQSRVRERAWTIPLARREGEGAPDRVFISQTGDSIYCVWTEGHGVRLDVRVPEAPRIAEFLDMAPREGERITAAAWLLGHDTLVVGTNQGRVTGWFDVRPPQEKEREDRWGRFVTQLQKRRHQARLEAEREQIARETPDPDRRARLLARLDRKLDAIPADSPLSGTLRSWLDAAPAGPAWDRRDPTAWIPWLTSRPTGGELGPLGPEERTFEEYLRFLVWEREIPAPGAPLERWQAWLGTRPVPLQSADGLSFIGAKPLADGGAPVTALTASDRTKLVAVGHADGRVRMYFATNESLVLELQVPESPRRLVLAPRGDTLLAFGAEKVYRWDLDLKYPDVTFASLFTPQWYERASAPEHTWQSTGGSDGFEPKLGLLPLVFGTLKATFYSLLFGIPVALLAAIFTSEFLPGRVKASIKSVVETMAGLPSVVLGFLAALVIAPLVEGAVASIVAAFLLLPIAFLLGAYLWQLLPSHVGLRLEGWPRFACLLATLLLAVLVATWLGPVVERVLFARNIVDWLNGNRGSGAGGWFLLFLPIFALLAALAMGRWVRPWLRSTTRGWTRRATALADIGRFAAGGLVVVLVAYGVATLVAAMGVDPRGSVPQGGVGIVGTYVQRNALIVGFVMGFAIIPIIYTLAEDALSSVPFHLREGSLGAGATRWQTAVRIIVPTAMSGLFSACMIGMGRAVGETMIVLMAAGNTPLMDLNVFNGFRTLSANVAVELPEAVVGDSHYRTLFLNGLVLFAMTFVVNTIAETVRLRFRRMAFHL